MRLYIRKSSNLGPLRLSGIGVSAGVTGARFEVNARGKKYIHLGRGGLYHRTSVLNDLQAVGDAESSGADISWGIVLVILGILFVLYTVLAH
jgi:hypothetical protein